MKWSPIGSVLVGCLLVACGASGESSTPTQWTKLVKVEGQSEPIPEQWLDTEEARIAHNMKLPDVVAKTVPFDFDRARWMSWLPGVPEAGKQYFKHLCDTEAGEWLLKKAPSQPGIYNARPMRQYSTVELQARHDLEAPLLQRERQIKDTIESGTYFVNAPFLTYDFVEEPHRDVDWQVTITQLYVRLFGYRTRHLLGDPPSHPMEMTGVDRPSARYALTWRGVKRVRDREHSISGMEMMVYDRQSGDVLAVRRQFVFGTPYKGRPDSNSWAQGAVCERLMITSYGGEALSRLPLLVAAPEKPMTRWTEPPLAQPTPTQPK